MRGDLRTESSASTQFQSELDGKSAFRLMLPLQEQQILEPGKPLLFFMHLQASVSYEWSDRYDPCSSVHVDYVPPSPRLTDRRSRVATKFDDHFVGREKPHSDNATHSICKLGQRVIIIA